MVLDCLGATTPPFLQGGLQAFRDRMLAHEMDRVLLDRTVALVRSGAMSESERRSVSKALGAIRAGDLDAVSEGEQGTSRSHAP